jgi:UDP-N-acetylmuramoyl-L-alanyl-D-glutamate--2,6-diaminopimelate ligase
VVTGKRVSAFSKAINIVSRRGDRDPEITHLAYDSRNAGDGSLFFALEGLHVDGHRFIDDAIANGARAVIHSKPLSCYAPSVVYLQTENTRTAISAVAAAFYDHPSEEMTVIGVTGTDGKSTTVYLIHQLLEKMGYRSGFLSTVHYQDGDSIRKNQLRQSTPEAVEIHQLLHRMRANAKTHAVLEATSHGLSPRNNRLGDVSFDVAVFTNLSHEHLEFHGSFEQYRDDKANLLRYLRRPPKKGGGEQPVSEEPAERFAVLNRDDDHFRFFEEIATGVPVYTYSVQDAKNSDLGVRSYTPYLEGSDVIFTTNDRLIDCYLPLPGSFNVENILAALLTVTTLTGEQIESLASIVPHLRPVPGRMNSITAGQPFSVIIDYAHTPGSFTRFFPFVREHTQGRLIAVFGSAGERDIEKRPQQGSIADRYADIIVLTDEDPRGEDPQSILEDIRQGCRDRTPGTDLFLIPERREAIAEAFRCAQPGDTVVLLGKGHEESILYADGAIRWDESGVAREVLQAMGFKKERATPH